MISKHFIAFAVLCGTVCAVGPANAAIVVTTESDRPDEDPVTPQTTNTPYTPVFSGGNVSGTDLLNGLTPVDSTGNFTRETTVGGLPVLTDGSFDTFYGGNSGGTGAPNRSAFATMGDGGGAAGAGRSVTYALGSAFNLSEIVVYGGWVDGGRDQQNLDIFTSPDGTNFTSLGAMLDGNLGTLTFSNGTRSPISHRNSIIDDAGFLATDVTHIRFDQGAVENGYAGYAEFDAFGTPAVAVPEPSSIGLAMVALTGVVVRHRRRNRS